MSFKSTITLKYDSEWTYGGSEFLPEEHLVLKFPSDDLTTNQLFIAFRKFLLAAGYQDSSIASGAVSLAFSDSLSEEQMRKTAEYYDLILAEDHYKKIQELEDQIQELEGEVISLKAHLSRAQNPSNPNYTDSEMEAMCSQAVNKVTKKTLENAYKVCRNCGDKYGTYKGGVSSWWNDDCDVCNKEAPVTEARDFSFLKKGIEELSK